MTTERGIRRTGSGWQVCLRVQGEFRSKHCPPDTPLVELRARREHQKARQVLNLPAEDGPGFSRDADTYLGLVTGMPTYAERDNITAVQIRQQLGSWRARGNRPAR